jgi:hypothetical protein
MIALGMIESESKTIGGIKMRPFSIGSRQIADLLNISMIYGDSVSDIEQQRQIISFVWMQSAPEDEVAEAIANNTAGKAALVYALGIEYHRLPEINTEIDRIGKQLAANEIRVESKYKSDEETPPGKS